MSLLLAAALLAPPAPPDPTPSAQDPDLRFEVVALRHAVAEEAVALLQDLVPQARVRVDPRTNSLLLAAPEGEMVRLEQAIVGLDRQAGQDPSDLFPLASDDMVIAVGEGGASWTMMDLVQDYARLTGQQVQIDNEARQFLENTLTGLTRSVVVPRSEVQSFFEEVLYENDFVLHLSRETSPRLLQITSLQSGQRNTVRTKARFVPEGQLQRWAEHPALLISTVVTLPNTDVRQLSNSMRTMITDANTQQMLPAGNTNSMVLTGFAGSVVNLAEMLAIVDAAAAIETTEPTFSRFPLSFASANDVAPLIEELVAASDGLDGRNQQQPQGVVQRSRPRARVIADARTNALVVMCVPQDLPKVAGLVKLFDVEQKQE